MSIDRAGLREALIPYFRDEQHRVTYLTDAFWDDEKILHLFVFGTSLEPKFFVNDILTKLMDPKFPRQLRSHDKLSIVKLLEVIIKDTGAEDILSPYIDSIQAHFGGNTHKPPENTHTKSVNSSNSQIFVSYRSLDREFVNQLVNDLRTNDYSVWWDREIKGGEAWQKVILEQLRNSRLVVCVITPDSVSSAMVRAEISIASKLNIPIIPALWKPTPLETLPLELVTLNYVDFQDPDNYATAFTKLLVSLKHHLGR